MTNGGCIIPTLRYTDANRMIDFLREAFGFEKSMVVPGDGDTVAHAQLTYDNGMIMLGSAQTGNEYGDLVTTPEERGGTTQGVYIVVKDVDAHCERARKAGAEIVMEPTDQDYGGRDYTCRDPEGHVWSFGTYDPWA